VAVPPPHPLTQSAADSGRPTGERPTRVRHVVLGLTVAAYMITYMDRQILAVARPAIRDELGISLVMMGWITFSFRIAYALFQLPGGWLGDRFGARRALTWVVTWWSIFTGITALAWNAVSMLVIQIFFGLGEAGAFPSPRVRYRAGCGRRSEASHKASHMLGRGWVQH